MVLDDDSTMICRLGWTCEEVELAAGAITTAMTRLQVARAQVTILIRKSRPRNKIHFFHLFPYFDVYTVI